MHRVPQVRDSLTLDEYIQSLKNSSDVNFRGLILPSLFERHGNAPKLIEYYQKAFKENPKPYSDTRSPLVWNEAFLEPLVHGCENDDWQFFSALRCHADKWRDQPAIVKRLSDAVMKQHPILGRPVVEIPEKNLEKWAVAVDDASQVGDLSFVDWLRPGLTDKRDASINLGAGGIQRARVCDRSLDAILMSLDGDSWTAFEKAGINEYTLEEKTDAYDRVIVITQERLRLRETTRD